MRTATKRKEPLPAPRWRGRKPILVCVDGQVITDIVVIVSEKDPNSWRPPDKTVVISVKRRCNGRELNRPAAEEIVDEMLHAAEMRR